MSTREEAMLGEGPALEALERALAMSQADETEVALWSTDSALTRFANNTIHQNVAEVNSELILRLVFGKRIGIASTNRLDEPSLRDLVARAAEIAGSQPPKEEFVTLPDPEPIAKVDSYRPDVEGATALFRAQAAAEIIARTRKAGVTGAGLVSTDLAEFAVANSRGVRAYERSSFAEMRLVAMADEASGYADHYSLGLSGFDPGAVADRAIAKCMAGARPVELSPGEYTVILEESAVAVLLLYLAYMGLDALSLQEKRSFLSGRLGEKLVGENVTLWDDGLDSRGFPRAFDFEGVPKRPVHFFRTGVAEGVVYDSFTANREGRRSTGHALPAGATFGPLPMNIFLAPGSSSVEEMISSTERGVLVTTFHYANVLEPRRTLVTGMTRHGTFLVEGGRVVRPVKNLRFTQNVLEALSRVTHIGRELRAIRESGLAIAVPALRIEGFSFTGATR